MAMPVAHRRTQIGHTRDSHKKRGPASPRVEGAGKTAVPAAGSGATSGGPGKLLEIMLSNGRMADTRIAMSQTLYLVAALRDRSNLMASQAAASTRSICQLQARSKLANWRDTSTT